LAAIYLTWALLFVAVALISFPFLQMIINKNHEAVKAVANASTVTKTAINTLPIPAATPQEQAPAYLQLYHAANPNDNRDDISILAQAKLDGKLDAYPAEQARLNKWAKAMSDPSSEISQFYRQKKLAESGDAAAQLNLGNCYIAGKGVGIDSVEGLKWVRKAADQGNADAELQLGFNYQEGIGVAQDYVQAWKLFKLAEAQIPNATIARANAIIARVACESSMTLDQITEAQKLSSEFKPHAESASTNSN
jgi:TPR repeat protein